jgi:glutamate dehydrogenase (NAD(P)+)
MSASDPHEVVTVRGEQGEEIGWLVIDRLVEGLSFGGFRFSPDVTRGEVERLARCMSHKLALHGHPVGGAKAGLRCDPRAGGIEQLLDRFATAARDSLTSRAIVGRDMGATDALIDGLYQRLGVTQMSVAGVESRLRDLTGYRRHMTGLGVAYAARRAMGGDLAGVRVGIQGFGLVGAGSALRLSAMGASIVAVSDATGALIDGDGIDIDVLYGASGGSRALPTDVHKSSRDSLFSADADLVLLAASSNSVDVEQARAIRAKVVVEGSNFGLTDAGRGVLQEMGVCVIPDLIASSSSAAMVARQMQARGRLEEDALWSAIETAIDEATASALARSRADGTDVRTAYLRTHGS